MSFNAGKAEYEILVEIRDAVNKLNEFERKTRETSQKSSASFGRVSGSVVGLASNVASLGFGIDNLSKSQLRIDQASQKVEKAQLRVNKLIEQGKKNTEEYQIAIEDLRLAEQREAQAKSDQQQAQVQLGLSLTTFATSTLPNAIKGLAGLAGGAATTVGALGAQTTATNVLTASTWKSTFAFLANPIFAIATAASIAAAVALVATNTWGLRDAIFGVTEATTKNTKAVKENVKEYDHMGNVIPDNSAVIERFSFFLDANTQELDKNTEAISRNVGARGVLKKKIVETESALEAESDLQKKLNEIALESRTRPPVIKDAFGNVISEAEQKRREMFAGIEPVRFGDASSLITTFDAAGRVLYRQDPFTKSFFDKNGKPITKAQVNRLEKSLQARPSATGTFDFFTDPVTGITKAIPKGVRGGNISGSLNTQSFDFFKALAVKRGLGINLIRDTLAGKGRPLGGIGPLGIRISQLARAGINLASGGFGNRSVGTAGGGRRAGRRGGGVSPAQRGFQRSLSLASEIPEDFQMLASFLGMDLPEFRRTRVGRMANRGGPFDTSAFFANIVAQDVLRFTQERKHFTDSINSKLQDLMSGSGLSRAQVITLISTSQGKTDLDGIIDFNKRRTLITSGVA